MRCTAFILLLLALPAAASAQDPTRRESTERRMDRRADSLRDLRQQARDEVRRRIPSDERLVPPNRPVARPGTAGTSAGATLSPAATRADTARVRGMATPEPVAAPAAAPIRVVRRAPVDTVDALPPRSRARALLMRLRHRPDAPAFCNSGAGHPVFGREWCFERGFRMRDWEREAASDLLVHRPAAGTVLLDRAAIRRLLGDPFAERVIETHAALGLPDPIRPRWISTPTGGAILTLVAGNTAFAELVDRNRDGRAEVAWIARVR